MQNEESVKVVDRFFTALEVLKERKVIRGRATFCRIADINRRNLWQLDRDRTRDIFQPGWLTRLVELGISPRWLLTGEGPVTEGGE